MKRLVFFNQYHNGDCFVGKEYVRAIARALPAVEISYAHANHPDIIRDLPVKYVQLNQIPELDHMTRVAESTDGETIYINTWVGCWQGVLFPYGEHINNQRLHAIWSKYFEYLKIPLAGPEDYLPSIDFAHYTTDAAAEFVQQAQVTNEKIVIFCNGPANSGQSRAGNFESVIRLLAADFPKTRFLLTAPIDGLTGSNIYYANEVIPLASNLNQIAYVSQFSEMIIGKNSGPFTWCQFKDNLLDSNRTFFNFSVLPTDCPSGGSRYLARCLFSPVTDDARIYELIKGALMQPNYRGTEFLT